MDVQPHAAAEESIERRLDVPPALRHPRAKHGGRGYRRVARGSGRGRRRRRARGRARDLFEGLFCERVGGRGLKGGVGVG